MALISNTLVSGLTDKVASEVVQLVAGMNAIRSGTPFYSKIHQNVPQPGDYSVENALITSAYTLDTNTISGSMLRTRYVDFMNNLESHVLSYNSASFDAFLNTSGINVHPSFEEAWFRSKSSHLSVRNVFFSAANVLVATYSTTASGTGNYLSNTPVATNPDAAFTQYGNQYAAANFVIIPTGNVLATTVINPYLLDENKAGGTTTSSQNVTITSGTASGTQFVVTGQHINATNIVAAGGLSGNDFRVYALLERTIAF